MFARNAFDKIKIDSKLNMLVRNDKAISSFGEKAKELSIGGEQGMIKCANGQFTL